MASIYYSPGGISKHSKDRPDGEKYNENNYGASLIYEWKDDENERLKKYITGGLYKNSLDKDSYFFGGGIKNRLLGNDDAYLDAGVIGGLITGYNDSVIPALMPTLSIGKGPVGLNLMYVPEIDGLVPEIFMLNSQLKLK